PATLPPTQKTTATYFNYTMKIRQEGSKTPDKKRNTKTRNTKIRNPIFFVLSRFVFSCFSYSQLGQVTLARLRINSVQDDQRFCGATDSARAMIGCSGSLSIVKSGSGRT